MKREIFICDRCGKEIGEKNEYTVKMRNGTFETDYDFCPMCASAYERAIDSFMKGEPETVKEPEKETPAQPDPEPEKKKHRGRPKKKPVNDLEQTVKDIIAAGD